MEYIELPGRPYRDVVEDLLKRRGVKNRLGMLVWLRNQKEKKAIANEARVTKARDEMGILTEMIEEEKGEGDQVVGAVSVISKEKQE